MFCSCGGDTKVTNSRYFSRDKKYFVLPGTVKRRRKCLICECTFSTVEMNEDIINKLIELRDAAINVKGIL